MWLDWWSKFSVFALKLSCKFFFLSDLNSSFNSPIAGSRTTLRLFFIVDSITLENSGFNFSELFLWLFEVDVMFSTQAAFPHFKWTSFLYIFILLTFQMSTIWMIQMKSIIRIRQIFSCATYRIRTNGTGRRHMKNILCKLTCPISFEEGLPVLQWMKFCDSDAYFRLYQG